MAYKHIKVPSSGEKIRVNQDFSLTVPDTPIIPYRATAPGSTSPR